MLSRCRRPRRPRRSVSSDRNELTTRPQTSARTSCASQLDQLRRSMRGLRREGFHRVVVLDGVEEIDAATFDA